MGGCQLIPAGQDAVHPDLERGERMEGERGKGELRDGWVKRESGRQGPSL